MNRRGVALPLALLALLFILGTAALLLEAAQLRRETGERQLAGRLAGAAAAGSVAERVASWDSSLGTSSPGAVLWLGTRDWSGRLEGTDSVVRLGAHSWLVFSSVFVRDWRSGVLARRGAAQVIGLTPSGHVGAIPGGWWDWDR